MAKKSAVQVLWDRKKVADKKGYGHIEIIIYFTKKERKHISFGKCTPMEWRRLENSKEIREQVKKYEGIVELMKSLHEEMTIANFEAHQELREIVKVKKEESGLLYNGNDLSGSFIEFIRSFIEQEDVAKGTKKHKRCVLRSIEESGFISTYNDLTPANIMRYDRWLHDGVRTNVTIATYHKYLHYYINVLLMQELIPRDPYKNVVIKKGQSQERQPLTEEELIKVRDAVLEREKLDRVRDLFIFMAYTGLSYIDTQSFDFKKMTVFDKETGLYFIDGRRLKTKTKYFTPILPPAQKVLEKNNYQLLKISNQKANDHLHTIEEKLGIEHPMTCHIARHSFATLCLAHGVPADNVSKMLGHTNLKTTMRYAKTLQTTIRHNTSALVGSLL
ncbi:MAG: tyrosine-type recombinase/integrase [Prevotella sp.]|nr:tyrosine-type recombinase/integrase [Prevotella sp.]